MATHIGIRLAPIEREALERAAQADERSISAFVRKILSEWLREREYLPREREKIGSSSSKLVATYEGGVRETFEDDAADAKHPLVVDESTRLCHYATQEDIRRLEAIRAAYIAMVEDARTRVEAADRFIGRW